MPLEFRYGRNGKLVPNWYGRYEINGKRHTIDLGVRIAGHPPDSLSLRDLGDHAFERSRTLAQAKLDNMIEDARRTQNATHLVQRLYEIKTGETLKPILLKDLPEEWYKIPRKRKPSTSYALQGKATLLRFVTFMEERYAKVKELNQLTRTMAQSFLDNEANRGVSPKTWNDTLKLLRAAFKHIAPDGSVNPFSGIPTREVETIYRIPFTPDELNAILEAAKDDDFIRPILITGICTAMRRGDCCLLKWKDVDLKNEFITVKTAKTGQTVTIPIFPLLLAEISKKEPSEAYVFPKQAEMYLKNPDGITLRVRKILALAGFKDGDQKRDLIENGTFRGEIHAERKEGLRRASIRDFHSFRVTWVTIALTAGVPLELVQKVTGHKTTDIVFKHYFQPGKEDFRQALQSAMPHLLVNRPISLTEASESM